jgi:hypothetical protein
MTQYIKKTARNNYMCNRCGKTIRNGDKNYVEERFLASLHSKTKRFCVECFEQQNKSNS